MRDPSASNVALALACEHPFTSGKRWPEDQSSIPIFGRRTHLAIDALSTGDAAYPAAYADLSAVEIEKLDACVLRVKEILAREASRVERALHECRLFYQAGESQARLAAHGETKPPGWWTAIADYIALGVDGTLLVRNWKTGRAPGANTAGREPQLWLEGIAAARAFGRDRVRVEFAYIDAGGIDIHGADLGPFELAEIAHELRALRGRLAGGPTPPRPGAHCTERYCRLAGVCPATQAALASTFTLEQPLTHQIRDEAHARFILERLPGAQAALDAVRDAVKAFAKQQPIHGDGPKAGQVFAWRTKTRRAVRVETEEQRAALKEVLGEHADKAVRVEHRASIESIEGAVREALNAEGRTRGMKRMTEDVLAALERAGGLNVSTWQEPEWFKPKEEEE